MVRAVHASYAPRNAVNDPALAKHLFFWRDKVVFEDFARYASEGQEVVRFLHGEHDLSEQTCKALNDVFISAHAITDSPILPNEFKGPSATQAGGGERYHFEAPSTPHQHAYNAVLRICEQRRGVASLQGHDLLAAQDQAQRQAGELLYWEHIHKKLACDYEAQTPIEEAALLAASNSVAPASNAAHSTTLGSLVLPNISALSWDDLASLKRDSGYRDLRHRVRTIADSAGSDRDKAVQDFQAACDDAREEIYERARPKPFANSIGTAAVEKFVSMLSLDSIKVVATAAKEYEAHQRLAWHYTYTEIKKAAK